MNESTNKDIALLAQRQDQTLKEIRELKELIKQINLDVEFRLRVLERGLTESQTRWNMLTGGALVSFVTALAAAIKAFLS